VFNSVSPECKDLIKKILVTDPDNRLTGQEAIHHPWFTKFSSDGDHKGSAEMAPVDEAVVQRLRTFKGGSTFQRAAMNLLVKTTSDEEVHELREIF